MAAVMVTTGATKPRLGLDLQGGTSVILQPRLSGGGKVTDSAINEAVDIIRQRVNGLGVTEADVQTQGHNIVVSVPGATSQQAVELIASTAQMRFRPVLAVAAGTPGTPAPSTGSVKVSSALLKKFEALDCSVAKNRQGGGDEPADQPIVACDRDGTSKYVLAATAVEGTTISNAQAGIPQGTNEWIVSLNFDHQGTAKFRDVTTKLLSEQQPQNQFAIVLDNVVVSAPVVEQPITNGRAQITGNFTQATAQDLANVLRYGALPLTFDRGEVNTISASVGADQLHKGIEAGLIGLGLVVVYTLLFYRALGLVSILSLATAGATTYASICLLAKAIGFALILPGVIGVIVSIGITADSFVVFFERLRDEIREGRTIRSAVEGGWVRARRTIMVADTVTFLAAIVLYVLSIGSVQNFAFTLGLTTLIDIFVVFLFTKPMVTLLVRRPFFGNGHHWSGLNRGAIGAHEPRSQRPPRPPVAPGRPAPAAR
jgi:preprotein translocase subunit SecD